MNLDYEKAYNDFKKQKEEREVFENEIIDLIKRVEECENTTEYLINLADEILNKIKDISLKYYYKYSKNRTNFLKYNLSDEEKFYIEIGYDYEDLNFMNLIKDNEYYINNIIRLRKSKDNKVTDNLIKSIDDLKRGYDLNKAKVIYINNKEMLEKTFQAFFFDFYVALKEYMYIKLGFRFWEELDYVIELCLENNFISKEFANYDKELIDTMTRYFEIYKGASFKEMLDLYERMAIFIENQLKLAERLRW
ncbi:hypothetical protein [Clostridium perfringens]|uniref:hypothetical protein n=1 Tax=Clostridium perfringens TaxID=1502 RepID=UPI003F43F32C